MHRSPAASGVFAILAAVVATELVALALPGDRLITVALADAVVTRTPGGLATAAVSLLRGASRAVLFGSIAVVLIGAGALAGAMARRSAAGGATVIAALAGVGIAAGITDAFVPALAAIAAPVAGGLVGVAVLRGVAAVPDGAGPPETAPSTTDRVTADGPTADRAIADRVTADWADADRALTLRRRRFLFGALATSAAAVTIAFTGRALRDALFPPPPDVTLPPPTDPLPAPGPATSLEVPGITELITPNDDFYRIDTATSIPRIDAADHRLQIVGMVDDPYEITYDELVDLADTEVDVTLTCVSNEVGGGLVGNARWFGVPLEGLLRRAGVQDGADQVVGRAVDNWTAGFPLEAALDGRPAIVAIGMNGEPLPRRHGFPIRLVVAGLYGYVSDTKWLSQIELTRFDDFDAYWVERGWDRFGPIRTQTRIDVPSSSSVAAGETPVAGVAWAGDRGITAVEVAIDDGPWREAELAKQLATTSWRQWVLRWEATPGVHRIRARAVDGDGVTQTAERRPPEPSGATGYHDIEVRVT